MKLMTINREMAIGIMLITGFIFAVSFGTLYTQTHINQGTVCSCTLPIPILIPTFSSLGVFVGSFVYFLMFSKIKDTKVQSTEDAKKLLDLLQNDEKRILSELVKNKGEVLQSKLSKKFGKVKVFRTLEGLKQRKIITKKDHGRTNKIILNESFKEVLC